MHGYKNNKKEMSKTIKKEMKAGRPQKQAVAMAYSMAKAKKMSKK